MSATKQIELAALEERIRITNSKIAKMQLQVDGWLAELPAAKAAAEEEARSFVLVEKPKKISARTGKSTVYGDFSSKIQKEHIDAIKTFKEANPEMKGAHMIWVGNYKKENAEEYATFKAAWDIDHPKSDVSETSSVASSAEAAAGAAGGAAMNPEDLTLLKAKKAKAAAKKAAKKSEAAAGAEAAVVEKPKKVLSPEHLAKLKAGREAKAAAKKAAASIDDAVSAAAGELIYPSV